MVSIYGKVRGPIDRRDNEIEFQLSHNNGKILVLLNSSIADRLSVREGLQLKVYGCMLGCQLHADAAVLYKSNNFNQDHKQFKKK